MPFYDIGVKGLYINAENALCHVRGRQKSLGLRPVPLVLTRAFRPLRQRIPHFCYGDEVDMTALAGLKGDLKAAMADHDLRFSFLPFFVKAVSLALLDHPGLNASVDDAGEKITFKVTPRVDRHSDLGLGLGG